MDFDTQVLPRYMIPACFYAAAVQLCFAFLLGYHPSYYFPGYIGLLPIWIISILSAFPALARYNNCYKDPNTLKMERSEDLIQISDEDIVAPQEYSRISPFVAGVIVSCCLVIDLLWLICYVQVAHKLQMTYAIAKVLSVLAIMVGFGRRHRSAGLLMLPTLMLSLYLFIGTVLQIMH
jgi:hypothetical protein